MLKIGSIVWGVRDVPRAAELPGRTIRVYNDAYYKSRGGYKSQVLTGHRAEDEKFTGGIKAPVA